MAISAACIICISCRSLCALCIVWSEKKEALAFTNRKRSHSIIIIISIIISSVMQFGRIARAHEISRAGWVRWMQCLPICHDNLNNRSFCWCKSVRRMFIVLTQLRYVNIIAVNRNSSTDWSQNGNYLREHGSQREQKKKTTINTNVQHFGHDGNRFEHFNLH